MRLLIETSTVSFIERCVRNVAGTVEVGGLLIGFRRGEDIHLTKATVPAPMDECRPFLFVRKDPRHQTAILQQWISSACKLDWVGEWHTHPEPNPRPSGQDRLTWRKQVAHRKAPMVYVILGTTSKWVGMLAHETARPEEFRILETDPERVLYGQSS